MTKEEYMKMWEKAANLKEAKKMPGEKPTEPTKPVDLKSAKYQKPKDKDTIKGNK